MATNIVKVNLESPRTVDSIAALEALNVSKQTGTVYLDAGGRSGWFKWDNSDLSTEVSNNTAQSIYVAPSSDATGASGAWVRDYQGPVDVKWFGATGDGVTDDSTAIQTALDEADDELYFSAGKYLCESSLLLDRRLNLSFSKGKGNTQLIAGSSLTSSDSLLQVTSNYCDFDNLSLRGNGSATILDISTAKRLRFNNLYISSLSASNSDIGIYMNNTFIVQFINPFIEYVGTAIKMIATSIGLNAVNAIDIYGVTIEVVTNGIVIGDRINGITSSAQCNNINIIGGTIEAVDGKGIDVNSVVGLNIDGVYFEECKYEIYSDSSIVFNCNVSNCKMTENTAGNYQVYLGSSPSTNNQAFTFSNNYIDSTISGNTMVFIDAYNQWNGIRWDYTNRVSGNATAFGGDYFNFSRDPTGYFQDQSDNSYRIRPQFKTLNFYGTANATGYTTLKLNGSDVTNFRLDSDYAVNNIDVSLDTTATSGTLALYVTNLSGSNVYSVADLVFNNTKTKTSNEGIWFNSHIDASDGEVYLRVLPNSLNLSGSPSTFNIAVTLTLADRR